MTNSYHEGFSKTASAHGVDPDILLKFAEYCKEAGFKDWIRSKARDFFLTPQQNEYLKFMDSKDGKTLIDTAKSVGNTLSEVKNWWGNLDPNMKRGLGGMALTGLGSMLFTDGNLFQRLIKGLGYGTLGGAAAYGLSRSGLYDKGINYLANNWGNTEPTAQPGQAGVDSFLAQREAAAPYLSQDYMPWSAKAIADQQALQALKPTP